MLRQSVGDKGITIATDDDSLPSLGALGRVDPFVTTPSTLRPQNFILVFHIYQASTDPAHAHDTGTILDSRVASWRSDMSGFHIQTLISTRA
ncbi:hypothetical protein Vi05172_g5029 [Venturia inaequalis]|nr:hypothetical protein Vi05172_g5029 [Venturia inaequalis]